MKVKEIIDPRMIKTRLTSTSKEGVLRELAEMLLVNGYISDMTGFIEDIYVREAEGQTGIGNYIAIPHGKSRFVKKNGVAIGVTDMEIPWETLDGRGVKGIVLFAVGDDNEDAQKHLKLLSLFAKKLGNDDLVKQLVQARNVTDVLTLFS